MVSVVVNTQSFKILYWDKVNHANNLGMSMKLLYEPFLSLDMKHQLAYYTGLLQDRGSLQFVKHNFAFYQSDDPSQLF